MFLEVRVSVFGGKGELLEGCPGLFSGTDHYFSGGGRGGGGG